MTAPNAQPPAPEPQPAAGAHPAGAPRTASPRRLGSPPPPALLDAAERWSADELRAHQLERLRTTLRRVHDHVPAYREKFEAAGVHPDDLCDLSDLARFPFTSKADLRAAYPFGLLAVPRERLARLHASSGSTGTPTVVGYTARDIDVWAGAVARSLRAAGARPGDLVHNAYGYGLFTGGLGAHYGAERAGCTVVPASGGMTARQVQLIRDFRPDVITVTPTYMLTLLDEFERQGLDPRDCSLRIGVFGAEPWTEQMRRELEERLGLHALDIYGLSELMGPGVAQECVETKDGLHIWADLFYPEVIDPVTEQVLPEGQEGELVLTSLQREAMPLVRYRTRDLTALLPGTARPAFPRMRRITGRSDDMIILRGVNVFPTQIEEIVLRTSGVAPHFQLHLTRPQRLDELAVRVESRPGAGPEQRAAAAEVIARGVKDAIGVSVSVEVVPPDTIERSVGKFRRVVDDRRPVAPKAGEESRR